MALDGLEGLASAVIVIVFSRVRHGKGLSAAQGDRRLKHVWS